MRPIGTIASRRLGTSSKLETSRATWRQSCCAGRASSCSCRQCSPTVTNPTRGDARSFPPRSEEHTSELQSLMRISYAVFCLTKKQYNTTTLQTNTQLYSKSSEKQVLHES